MTASVRGRRGGKVAAVQNELPTSVLSNFENQWWAGNVRMTDLSGMLLGAHQCHAALMSVVPGAFIVQEVARYQPGIPLAEQSMVFMPHLAALGVGVGAGGEIVDTYPFFVIGVLHFFIAAVCCAAGLYHTFRGEARLSECPEDSTAAGFHYEWEDFESTSYILGYHLLFIGVACLIFAGNAAYGTGMYDINTETVHQISPNLNPARLIGYLFGFTPNGWSGAGMAAVDNMEDVIGGHFLVGALDVAGAIFHIVYRQATPIFNKRPVFSPANGGWTTSEGILNGEIILSWSVAAVGFMGISSSIFIKYCDVAYPPIFHGVDRGGAAALQLILGLLWMVGGGLWHGLRGEKLYALTK